METTGDPYKDLKNSQEAKPKQGDIVSGIFPGSKASEGPGLVNQHGARIRSEMSGKEVQELRAQQANMKKAQFVFHIKTFTQLCEDNQIRMMYQIQNEHIPSKRITVLMEFGYSKGQLTDFINAIEEHDAEIKASIATEPLIPPAV